MQKFALSSYHHTETTGAFGLHCWFLGTLTLLLQCYVTQPTQLSQKNISILTLLLYSTEQNWILIIV